MIFQVIGLQFHFATYSREDKYKSRYSIKKGSSRYKGQQKKYQNAQRQTINKKSQYRSRDSNSQRKLTGRRNYIVERNLKEQHERMRGLERIGKRGQSSIKRQ